MKEMVIKDQLVPLYLLEEGDVFDPALVPETVKKANIIDQEGWLLFTRSDLGDALVRIKKAALPVSVPQYIRPVKKMPAALYHQAVAFFRAVFLEHHSEAGLYIFHHPAEDRWSLWAPRQEVTGISCHYDEEPAKYEGWVLCGTFHSHASMAAFHSGTDHHDEADFDGFHVTIGDNDRPGNPSYAGCMVVGGVRLKMEKEEMFSDLGDEEAKLRDRVRRALDQMGDAPFEPDAPETNSYAYKKTVACGHVVLDNVRFKIEVSQASSPAATSFPKEWLDKVKKKEWNSPNQGTSGNYRQGHGPYTPGCHTSGSQQLGIHGQRRDDRSAVRGSSTNLPDHYKPKDIDQAFSHQYEGD